MERACTYVDHFLQPLVIQQPSYLRDSPSVIQLFKDFEFEGYLLLVTCDGVPIYKHLSSAGCGTFLERGRDHMLDSFIVDLLDFVLRHNYFTFDGKFNCQVSGTAMGVWCAPSYANLFLSWWEATHMYPSLPFREKVLIWARFERFHPRHVKRGIPYGQFLRLRRNCTKMGEFATQAQELTQCFHPRGYPRWAISQACHRAKIQNRDELLVPKVKKKNDDLRVITGFNNR